LQPVPLIIPISDLRKDAAGVVREVVAAGDPVYVTQRGRTAAVLLSRLSYEGLRREHEILSRAVVGDLAIPLEEGLTLEDVLARGGQLLAEERRVSTEARLADARRSDAEEHASLRSSEAATLEDLLTSCGLGHLAPSRERPGSGAGEDVEVGYGPAVWYRAVDDE